MGKTDYLRVNTDTHGSRSHLAVNYHHKGAVTSDSTRIQVLLKHWYMNRGKLIPFALIPIPLLLTGCSIHDVGDLGEKVVHFFSGNENDKHLPNLAFQTMVWIFELISKVIWTPALLFDNSWFKEMIREFSLISMSFVTFFTMIEGVKRMMNLSYTSLKKILIRFPVAISVCTFAPIVFVKAVEWLNNTTQFIIDLSATYMKKGAVIEIGVTQLSLFEELTLLAFNILYIMLCIPILLYHSRRWFDLLCLGVLTPFAMLGYIFDSLNRFYRKWWSTIKSLFFIQLVYAVFVSVLAVVMFSIPFPTDSYSSILAKFLIMLGGLYRLAFPPNFVKGMMDKGTDSRDALTGLAKQFVKLAVFKRNV